MGRQIETIIDDFTGRVTTESRTKNKRMARAIKHFDILSSQDKLIPHRAFEVDTHDTETTATRKISKILSYGTSLSGTNQYGLGVNSGTNTPRIYRRSGGTPLPNAAWEGRSAEGTIATFSENLFVQYKGELYIGAAGTHIARYNVAGNSWAPTHQALTYTNIFQGLVHSKDDKLYVPYLTSSGAFIASYDNSSWNTTALTLPTNVGKIDICEYGNYLAIAIQPLYLGGRAYVYLWDRNSSLTTLSEKIDWGTENLELIENINGTIVGISTIANSAISFSGSGKIFYKYWAGAAPDAKPLFELLADDRSITIANKQKENNRMYYMMSAKLNGSWHEGVWSIGPNKNGELVTACEYLLNNDTQITSPVLKGFQLLGDYMTISYTDNGTYQLKITDSDVIYTDTSIYEFIIFNGSMHEKVNPADKKDLVGITALTEPLDDSPAGQVLARYKKDNDSSWTTIMTHDTDAAISDSAVNIESSGAALPKGYKELSFRLESTGSAVITGFSFKEDITGGKVYG